MQTPLDIHDRRILIVDDIEDNLDLILMLLEDQGFSHLMTAMDGKEALEKIDETPDIDLVLLDIFMPNLNGYEVLEAIKRSPKTADIPVIMISAHDKLDSVIRCIEGGALDYITKPVEETFLIARVQSTLERKVLQDQQKLLFAELEEEKKKSESILFQVLPESVAQRLKRGEASIADAMEDVTVVFADLVGFTALARSIAPDKLVAILNRIFGEFDNIASRFGLEKIKTIGDAYMVVGGIPPYTRGHAIRSIEFGLAVLEAIENFNIESMVKISVRLGMHSGPAVAGVIGHTRFSYDLWGDTVNVASRMEEMSKPDMIQISKETHDLVSEYYDFQPRGEVAVKGRGPMHAYLTNPGIAGHKPGRDEMLKDIIRT